MAEGVTLMASAAAGYHAAQSALRDEMLAQADLAAKGTSPYAAPPCDLMLGAEVFARLAANNEAGTLFDCFMLASILLVRSAHCRTIPALETYSDVMEDEARALFNQILEADREYVAPMAHLLQEYANAGNEWAATALTQLIDALPADEAATVAATVAQAQREHLATQEA